MNLGIQFNKLVAKAKGNPLAALLCLILFASAIAVFSSILKPSSKYVYIAENEEIISYVNQSNYRKNGETILVETVFNRKDGWGSVVVWLNLNCVRKSVSVEGRYVYRGLYGRGELVSDKRLDNGGSWDENLDKVCKLFW